MGLLCGLVRQQHLHIEGNLIPLQAVLICQSAIACHQVCFCLCLEYTLDPVSEIFLLLPALYIAGVGETFGMSPRRMAVTQVFILAGSQHRCSVDRADTLKVCLRCVKILTGKTDRRKRVQRVVQDTTTWLGIFLELNADGSDVLSGTGAKYTCSGMFRSVLKTA